MRPSRAREPGFTLLEMLIALALLSLIATLILAAIQGTGRALDVANRQAEVGSIGSAQMVLRQILSQAQPIKFTAERPEDARMLDGGPATIRLITSFAAGGQYGGLLDTELALTAADTGANLVIRQSVLRRAAASASLATAQGNSAVILKGIAKLSIRYFGRPNDDETQLAWSATWISTFRLPSLIALDITFPPGDPRIWPELVIAVPAAE